MRLIPFIASVICLFFSVPSLAQGWIVYTSQEDFLSINFPGEPEVRDIEYRTEFFITLPGRVHSFEDGPNLYSVTVVDYANTETKHEERLGDCQAVLGGGDSCNNPWRTELRGAIVYATWDLFQGVKKRIRRK